MRNPADQETQLQQALSETDAALERTATGLDGTAGNMADIAHQLPTTVHLADFIMADLGPDSDLLLSHMGQPNTAIGESPFVFGGRDANGYATRISLVLGCSTAGACPSLPSPSAIDFQLGKAEGQSKP